MHGVVEQAKNVSEFSENGGECRSFQAKEKRDRKARGFQAEEKRDEEERGFQVKENRGGEGQDFQAKEKRGGEDTAWQIERARNKYGAKALPTRTLILQAIATSIDALSVGFAIAEYSVTEALIAGAIIAAVTFCICIGGLLIGKKTGDLLGWRASIFGGIILIGIGIEIWAGGMF
ncbi:MAG: manganese efflux pump [Lachnospiraceae bacterium]|nr:manganese efflux pump [Lachnospiraceae bacterium]